MFSKKNISLVEVQQGCSRATQQLISHALLLDFPRGCWHLLPFLQHPRRTQTWSLPLLLLVQDRQRKKSALTKGKIILQLCSQDHLSLEWRKWINEYAIRNSKSLASQSTAEVDHIAQLWDILSHFKYLQRWRTHHLSGQPVTGIGQSHQEMPSLLNV